MTITGFHHSNCRFFCGKMSDEVINFLGQKYCDQANEESQMYQNILLPSYLSAGNVLKTVVEHITCHHNNLASVVNMFLPVHMNLCHWGLSIFSINNQTVFFDDGYHCPIPEELKQNANRIINIIFQTTGNEKSFDKDIWIGLKYYKKQLFQIKLMVWKHQHMHYKISKVYQYILPRSFLRAKRKCTIFRHFR